MSGSYFGQMVALARIGFSVVPRVMIHPEKGMGMLHMDGTGLRFMPFDKNHDALETTWEAIEKDSA